MTDYVSVTVRDDGFSLADVVVRQHGRYIPGMVEATFAANPGVAAHGIRLPVGTVVRVPQPTAADEARAVDIIRLGD
jgi:phage tail protein X